VLFDGDAGMVLSPLDNFLTGILALQNHTESSALVAGVQGNVTSLPPGYSLSFVIAAQSTGRITGTLNEWGSIMRRWHGTKRHQDLINKKLGYFTDNGAYYYGGNPPDGATLGTVIANLTQQQVPMQYLQLDPWVWKGYLATWPGGDLCEFTASPELFPQGFEELFKTAGVPLMLYSMYWCTKSEAIYELPFVYSEPYYDAFKKKNRTYGQPAPNSSYLLYNRIMSQHAAYLGAFEVDFMYVSLESITMFRRNATAAKDWLQGMNDAAAEHGVGIQYCMGLPSLALQSLEFNAVTNFRASDDNDAWAAYGVAPDRWRIGYTALLLQALDLAPSFDVIWSTAQQPGSKYNCTLGPQHSCTRPNIELEAAVSALSSGPVSFGDGPGFADRSLILKTCTKAGTLLHLSRPATPIDRTFHGALGNGANSSDVWVGHTALQGDATVGLSWAVLAVAVSPHFNLLTSDLWPRPSSAQHLLAIDTTTEQVFSFSEKESLWLETEPAKGPERPFKLYTVVAPCPSGAAFLGEQGKYAAISPQRVQSIRCHDRGICVELKAVEHREVIELRFWGKEQGVSYVSLAVGPLGVTHCT